MKNLEQRIAAIESRNKKVELDKLWETSVTRKIVIVSATYLTVFIYLVLIQ